MTRPALGLLFLPTLGRGVLLRGRGWRLLRHATILDAAKWADRPTPSTRFGPVGPLRRLREWAITQTMDRPPLHRIDECLTDQAFDAWVGEVVREVEDYLAKHAAFEAFLDGQE